MPTLASVYPPLLKSGAVIGLAAPASPPEDPSVIDAAIARLEGQGFVVREGDALRQRAGYLAGSDVARAADINALFAEPEVKAIFALRGGYGSCRLLSLLDYELIRAHPKPFIGYSDITAMHLAIWMKTGLVTFHGANASSAFEPWNVGLFHQRLMAPLENGALLFSEAQSARMTTLVPGRVTGPLLGGNMTCLLRLLGTPFEPDLRGALLFLEDTGEKAYRIDGNFTHLRLAGILEKIGGLILGQFDYADGKEEARIGETLRREAEAIGVPCVAGAPIGHFPEQTILPQGCTAELDADARTLRLVQ
jgi:muramoyltetrapeptide carboxypeptidase